MKWNMLFGTLIGFTIVFLLTSLSKGEFNWSTWLSWMIGGVFAYVIIAVCIKWRNNREK